MVAKKKRSIKPAVRSRRKKRGGIWGWKSVLALLAGIATILALLWFYGDGFPLGRFHRGGLKISTVESLLLAANIDPETEVETLVAEGLERWRIEVQEESKANDVVQGLKNQLHDAGFRLLKDSKSRVKGQFTRMVDIPLDSGARLRLIFVVKSKASTPAKPAAGAVTDKPAKPAETKAPPLGNPPVAVGTGVPDGREGLSKIVLIIDDIGIKKADHLKPILDLRVPITFAVLPFQPNSATNAIYLYQHQYEVMLHMPMEPDGYPDQDPGEGAILSHLSDHQIRRALDLALRNVPYAIGVNNHMGSKITGNRTLMRVILADLKERELFFVDSRTQKNSVAFSLAKSMGLRTAERDVFLDSEMSYDFAIQQLAEARRIARKNGLAVVIGHPYDSSLKALAEEIPKMEKEGFQFVFASKIVRNYADHL